MGPREIPRGLLRGVGARAGEAQAAVPGWPQSQHQVSTAQWSPLPALHRVSEVPCAGPMPLPYFPVPALSEGQDPVEPGLLPWILGVTCRIYSLFVSGRKRIREEG